MAPAAMLLTPRARSHLMLELFLLEQMTAVRRSETVPSQAHVLES